MKTDLNALLNTANEKMQPETFKDYCPNGLQVEGKKEIKKIISGVTASYDLIQAAVENQADAILVHHGLFWRGQDERVIGWLRERLKLLLNNDISLIAYHLPLDAHVELGNNAQLAKKLGLQITGQFGDQNLGFLGEREDGQIFADADVLSWQLEHTFGRKIIKAGNYSGSIEKLAWCSGGAQRYFEDAIKAGAKAFITGEISEPQAHLAKECGAIFYACGHHATERYGVQALGQYLAKKLDITHQYIEIDNPA